MDSYNVEEWALKNSMVPELDADGKIVAVHLIVSEGCSELAKDAPYVYEVGAYLSKEGNISFYRGENIYSMPDSGSFTCQYVGSDFGYSYARYTNCDDIGREFSQLYYVLRTRHGYKIFRRREVGMTTVQYLSSQWPARLATVVLSLVAATYLFGYHPQYDSWMIWLFTSIVAASCSLLHKGIVNKPATMFANILFNTTVGTVLFVFVDDRFRQEEWLGRPPLYALTFVSTALVVLGVLIYGVLLALESYSAKNSRMRVAFVPTTTESIANTVAIMLCGFGVAAFASAVVYAELSVLGVWWQQVTMQFSAAAAAIAVIQVLRKKRIGWNVIHGLLFGYIAQWTIQIVMQQGGPYTLMAGLVVIVPLTVAALIASIHSYLQTPAHLR